MSMEMLCRYDMETPMRDGTILRGDLYRPADEAQWPVLLLRTVFRKDEMSRAFGALDPRYFISHGFAVFIQDVRGLGRSDGEFDRFTADGMDGYDTIEWLAEQPFCNGRIGMIGEYYAGYLQLMAAYENPPHLYAICPVKTSVSINRDCDNRGFMFSSHIGWCLSRQINRLMDGRYDRETTDKYLPLLRRWLQNYPHEQLSALPLRTMPAVHDTPFPLLKDYFKHLVEGYDNLALMQKEGRGRDVSSIKIPAFYVSGWYDSARTPMIDHCMAQRNAGVDSRVLIAPWRPGEPTASPDGALNNGLPAIDLQRDMVQWFDYWLNRKEEPDFAPVRVSDPLSGLYYTGHEWPHVNRHTLLYFHSNGTLMTTPAKESFRAVYHHDPARPLMYQGFGWEEQRTDDSKVLCFETAPMEESIELIGFVKSDLWVSSTAKDADVMLSFGHIYPDGRRFILCDGATRIRYAYGWESLPLRSNEIRLVTVKMGNLCARIPTGNRLFLEIYGSAFPKYDVNHGTGSSPADDAEMIISQNTVYGGEEFPSCLYLPLK